MTISSLFTVKTEMDHRHPIARKLTHHDFPKGAFLLVKRFTGGNLDENSINENQPEDYDEMTNEILTKDMMSKDEQRHHHKNKHSLRFRRTTSKTFTIEHCCSEANNDACGRYFCH